MMFAQKKNNSHFEICHLKFALQEQGFEIGTKTTFDSFALVVTDDKRAATLDAGNIKLAFNSVSCVKIYLSFKDCVSSVKKILIVFNMHYYGSPP